MSTMRVALIAILILALIALAMGNALLAGGVTVAFVMWIAARVRRGDES